MSHMNLKRYTGRTSSEALAQVRQELGDDAVVLSTKPVANGVEVLAMAPDGLKQIEAAAAKAPVATPRPAAPATPAAAPTAAPAQGLPANAMANLKTRARSLAERIAARGERLEPTLDLPAAPSASATGQGATARRAAAAPSAVEQDVKALGMSTLTFQDYVRERMLRRQQHEAERQPAMADAGEPTALASAAQAQMHAAQMHATQLHASPAHAAHAHPAQANPPLRVVGAAAAARGEPVARRAPLREPPVLREELPLNDGPRMAAAGAALGANGLPRRQVQHELPRLRRDTGAAAGQPNAAVQRLDDGAVSRRASASALREHDEMLGELRSVRSLIEERFGQLAFMDRLQKHPKQVALSQQLFDIGLSPGMVRKLVQALPDSAPDGLAWAAAVLENNLLTDENQAGIEDHEGVYALIGPTGVGKTTSTAKIAAAFAAKHGAANLGLITLDAYRMGAHEQLRAYGRILGVAVHTAHDRASLEDLLELLASKRLVLIDTAGMAQRDSRTRELLEMLSHPAIRKLLVVNAAAQGETVEDVMVGYRVHTCDGVVVSKLDEAVKLGPALDALIRHSARVVGVANGQRVPEDWHRLSANALVQRALHGGGTASWRFNAGEVNLMFAATQAGQAAAPAGLHA